MAGHPLHFRPLARPARLGRLGALLLGLALPHGAAAQAPPSAAASLVPEPAADLRYSSAWVYKTLADYHHRYPRLTRLVQLGATHEKRPIWALAIGGDRGRGGRPAVLVNGAHHGIEPMSIELALDVAQVLLLRSGERRTELRPDPALDAQVQRWLAELVVWCVPVVNPDGIWALQHGSPRSPRKNGRPRSSDSGGDSGGGPGAITRSDGVDLNRNYPFRWGFLGEKGSSGSPQSPYYRGPAAGSEPETQAMMRLADSEHFVASISYHTGNVTVLAPYTIDGVQSPTPNEAWTVAEQLVAGLPDHPQGRPWAVRKMIYPVDGTDQDFLRARFGTLALLVEGARKDPSTPEERRAIVLSARPLWMRLLDRYLDGPAVSGRVTDAAGNPAVAEVSIDEVKTAEAEAWSTRCRDGRFDRYLPAPGRYTVRARIPGQPDVTRTIEVPAGRLQVDLTVSASSSASCPPAPK